MGTQKLIKVPMGTTWEQCLRVQMVTDWSKFVKMGTDGFKGSKWVQIGQKGSECVKIGPDGLK